ncbi:23S rRNA (adenine(2503)-C(2))-methyltransferase RlmN [Patescibacteria group bacterium]|nr:23S rRNA (adenine(2503)-C(2))-methyltransferase RlmN [Patescibacteria group bacterium]MBU1722138.1 23S rRNA (adenine(2503)-C(2))-methyltransferase RlmN [Patescibacteria group bacterium]MBU1901187.1 23S rRNA (adenine(2503)-C(2))-methyltransferase RlmN [Patescibacteria group bacterium]
MIIEELNNILGKAPAFRMKQAYKSVFQDLITDWSENTTLPKETRADLKEACSLDISVEFADSKKSDALKALIELEDGAKVETVLLRHSDGRNTACISSQVGCSLGCKFCATGMLGMERNLTVGEMVAQVLVFARYLKEKKAKHQRITNIVFMGMGEPMMNYQAVMETIRLLNNTDVFGIGARHMSISTSGIIDGIEYLSNEPLQVNLAISLHAPNDVLRSQLMPINRKYGIKDLMNSVKHYREKCGRRVMFEYIMLDGINDAPEHARELAELMQDKLYMVNLIRYNPTGVFKPSKAEKIEQFKRILQRSGVHVTQRHAFGSDINAACGQLATKRNKKA